MIITFVNRPICGSCMKDMITSSVQNRKDHIDDIVFTCWTEGCQFRGKYIKIQVKRADANV